MTNTEFQESVRDILRNDISEDGIVKLEKYAELFIEGKLLYKRFSPREQHGCSEGGTTNVIASIIAGAENPTNSTTQGERDFKGMLKSAERQAVAIDCDIRINTPDLRCGGIREYSAEIVDISDQYE